jgi:hypothetical protein
MTQSVNKASIVKEEARLTARDIFEHYASIEVDRALMHQAFQIPFAGTESTLSRARTKNLIIRFNPIYQCLVGINQGKYFISPAANVIVAHE